MSTEEHPKARVDRPDVGDLQQAVHALHGIFWALNMLVIHRAADDIAHEQDRLNGIDQLIMAGELITDELSERF